MDIVIISICAVLLLLILYTLCVRGRTGHKGLSALQGWSYAHRGLHGKGVPENSMAAFRKALEGGYGIELDVHLMRDGELAVIHDSSLKRTAGVDISIEEMTSEELFKYPLEGTAETVPLFRQVLALFNGKAPLIVELKPAGENHAALAQAACDLLDRYNCTYCIESFDPRCVHWLKENRPDVIRGQLAENFVSNKRSPLPFVLKLILTHQLENFLIQPDFVAYKFADRKNLGNALVRRFWGVQGVAWTLTSQCDYDAAVREGWLPIFEGFLP